MKLKNIFHSFRQKALARKRSKPEKQNFKFRRRNPKNQRARRLVYSGAFLLGTGVIVADRMSGEELDIIHTSNELNNTIINQLHSLSNGKYFGSPTLPIRCMEIIYGNKFDNRMKQLEYEREVIYMPDQENIALGKLIRLAV